MFMTHAVNTYVLGGEVRPFCRPCAAIVTAHWVHDGAPVHSPADAPCTRCAAPQRALPGVGYDGWRSYVRRALGNVHAERALATLYGRIGSSPQVRQWFVEDGIMLANGWGWDS